MWCCGRAVAVLASCCNLGLKPPKLSRAHTHARTHAHTPTSTRVYTGCGAQRNMTFYAALMNATEKPYFIENCHWGDCDDSDDSSCPTLDWCPFNWYAAATHQPAYVPAPGPLDTPAPLLSGPLDPSPSNPPPPLFQSFALNGLADPFFCHLHTICLLMCAQQIKVPNVG